MIHTTHTRTHTHTQTCNHHYTTTHTHTHTHTHTDKHTHTLACTYSTGTRILPHSTLTHLLLDSAAEGKGYICSMQNNVHQGRLHSIHFQTSVDDLVEVAGGKAPIADLLFNFFLGLPKGFQEHFTNHLKIQYTFRNLPTASPRDSELRSGKQ